VLGAGFGGLELTTRLSERFGADLEVVLVDRSDSFVFGFSKLDVMFGHARPDAVRHRYADLVRPGVRFVQADIHSIDPERRAVATDAGDFDADIVVVALGADLDPSATPGLLEVGHEFYTVAGAFRVADVLADFAGGRVIVAVTSMPFKCPPAPSETALLLDDHLTALGVRDRSEITLVMPVPAPIPPSPDASAVLVRTFAERGITWMPNQTVTSLDPSTREAVLASGGRLPFDLFLGVPKHHAPEVLDRSGLTVDGWIPVDPLTLETRFPGVYAVGDVTSVGTPKAGVFAEGQAAAVAERIIARIESGSTGPDYDGRGVCYLEFGGGKVGKVEVTFQSGQPPVGHLAGPSPEFTAEKAEFASSRIRRWFGNEWQTTSD
jgi:sulfide:quinone oxidoreductase